MNRQQALQKLLCDAKMWRSQGFFFLRSKNWTQNSQHESSIGSSESASKCEDLFLSCSYAHPYSRFKTSLQVNMHRVQLEYKFFVCKFISNLNTSLYTGTRWTQTSWTCIVHKSVAQVCTQVWTLSSYTVILYICTHDVRTLQWTLSMTRFVRMRFQKRSLHDHRQHHHARVMFSNRVVAMVHVLNTLLSFSFLRTGSVINT